MARYHLVVCSKYEASPHIRFLRLPIAKFYNTSGSFKMASEYSCPKCQNEHVQKMSVIVSSGTTDIDTESISSGVAIGIGGAAVGGGTTTTSGKAQTQLAKQFSEEIFKDEEKSQLLMGLGGIVGLIVGGWFYFAGPIRSPYIALVVSAIVFFIVLIPFVILSNFLDKTVFKSHNEEIEARQKKKLMWREAGCYCNRCGNKFIPGSGEVYNFSQ